MLSANMVKLPAVRTKPMPGELTPAAVSEALLPVKITKLRQAVAACTNLPELLRYKRAIDGLAAAAKTLTKELPEAAKDLRRVQKETIFKLGDLLNEYNGVSVSQKPSDRRKAIDSLGIPLKIAGNAARLASASAKVRREIITTENIKISNMHRAAPPRPGSTGKIKPAVYGTDAASLVFMGQTVESLRAADSGHKGLVPALRALRGVDASNAIHMTPAEKERAREMVNEMQEILDEVDRLMGPP
jgi:hypothetical protein